MAAGHLSDPTSFHLLPNNSACPELIHTFAPLAGELTLTVSAPRLIYY